MGIDHERFCALLLYHYLDHYSTMGGRSPDVVLDRDISSYILYSTALLEVSVVLYNTSPVKIAGKQQAVQSARCGLRGSASKTRMIERLATILSEFGDGRPVRREEASAVCLH